LGICALKDARGSRSPLEGHDDWVVAVAVTLDGRRAVFASADGTLKVWDIESGRELLRTLEGYGGGAVAVTPDGRRAVSASSDGTLKVWDLDSGLPIATFSCDAPALCCTVLNAWTIVAGDAGGQLHILALETA
jgi:WD40 repeat protein